MEQPQYSKVSFPLKWKLLISVMVLLVVILALLNSSTIFLIRDDKRAYTYQIQSIESILIGKEFAGEMARVIGILRQSLATVDANLQVTQTQRSTLQSIVDNQPKLLQLEIRRYFPDQKKSDVISIHKSKSESVPDFNSENKWINESIVEPLKIQDYAFVNLTRVESSPMIGIAYADKQAAKGQDNYPIAFGVLSLDGFLSDLQGSNYTVADAWGYVLFSADPQQASNRSNIFEEPLFQSATQSKVASGASEFSASDEAFLGSYYKPGLNLMVLTQTPWAKAMQSTYGLLGKIFFLLIMAISAGIIFALLFAKSLTAPIQKLYKATREVAQGNFDLEVKATSKDEIGALSTSFTTMSKKIQGLIAESMEKVRMEGELAIASTVQQTLIPPESYKSKNIQIQSHYQSASECGGDWWGFFEAKDKLVILIADATGHGLPSALITAAARSCFSVMHKYAEEYPDFSFSPRELLSFANRAVYDAASGKIMMTFFAAVVDYKTQKMNFANAGHNPPWLFQKSDGGTYQLKSLVSKGMRLGEMPNNDQFEEKSVDINAHDVLFLYTDGVTEGMNPEGVMYGKKQLRKVIQSNVAGGPELIIKSVMADFNKHNQDKPLDDDITLATALFYPGASA